MSDTQLIKDKLDIVDFVGEYVQLKPAGSTHKGLCPFHNEKTPSFTVSRDRQSWHCFGCNKGGDIFSFLQDIEGMEFIEALKYLAGKAGVEISFKENKEKTNQKNRLRDVMRDAVHFYHHVLTALEPAKPARDYLHGRGMLDETITAWQIGFVPDQWDILTKYLTKKGHAIEDLIAAGLTIKRDGANMQSGRGFYDRFRGRVMFPLSDVHGSVVGFTGRVLVETDKSGGKYVNTPQSPLFDKSRVIFGLSKAKQAIKKADLAVLVEGQMDVIASHQSGIANVVATSGTAMTEEHIRILARYTKNLAMAFDMDDAGQRAAKKGIDIALALGMNVRVIRIPDGAGDDPDDCIRKDPSVWEKSIAEAQDVMQWYMERAFAGKDIKNPKDKQAVANTLVPELARIPHAIEQDHWVQLIAAKLGVTPELLRSEMQQVKSPKKPEQRQETAETLQKEPPKPAVKTRLDMLIEAFLALLLSQSGLKIGNLSLSLPKYPLYELIRMQYNQGAELSAPALKEAATGDMQAHIDVLLLKGDEDFSRISDKEALQTAQQLLLDIRGEYVKAERARLTSEIERAEKTGDDDGLRDLLKQFQQLHDL